MIQGLLGLPLVVISCNVTWGLQWSSKLEARGGKAKVAVVQEALSPRAAHVLAACLPPAPLLGHLGLAR